MKFCSTCGKEVILKLENSYKRYVCKACGEIYYENPKPCVTALIVKEGRVLLTKRCIEPGKNKWDLVGGFLEKGEHPDIALKREVKEELGIQVVESQFFGFFMDEYGKNGDSTLNIAYMCQITGEPRIQVDEFNEIKWFTLSDLPGDYAFKNVSDILEAYKRFIETNELP